MTTLYDADFYAWTLEQSNLLKSGQLQKLDIENLVEEIESLGKQQRRELRNRLGILIGHLLKWQYQPDKRSKIGLGVSRNRNDLRLQISTCGMPIYNRTDSRSDFS